MSKKQITITTDFGDQFAAAQLKAVVCSFGFAGKIIENHSVTPFSITEGAFEILVLATFCPKDTVHLGVVDPGVGSNRAGIIIQTKKSWLVGPNNGLLYPTATKEKIIKVYKINEGKISKKFANTFHGRDIFIKAAVYLAQDRPPKSFGCTEIDQNELQKLEFKNGQVLHIDHYGNIKIYWQKKLNGKIDLNNKEIPVAKTFSDVKVGKAVAYWGSHNNLELAINQGRANKKLGIKLGEILKTT